MEFLLDSDLLITVAYAFLGGLLPTLIWLWFWLREDEARPEPRILIATAFIAGMIAVPFVLPVQRFALDFFKPESLGLIFAWATAEEVMKFLLAMIAVLWRKAVNEPIDEILYMLTIALGFAALENTLFLLSPITDGDWIGSTLTGNLRFLGATLLHTLSSSVIGLALAMAFFKSKPMKWLYATGGLILAIALHTLFNYFIINTNGERTLIVFVAVWLGIIGLILFFERVKKMGRTPIRS